MRTIVTARHCDIPEDLRVRAVDMMSKLAKLASRPQRAKVVFNDDHHHKVVELQLFLPRGQVRIASAEAADFKTALDRAADKLRPQLDRGLSRPARRASSA